MSLRAETFGQIVLRSFDPQLVRALKALRHPFALNDQQRDWLNRPEYWVYIYADSLLALECLAEFNLVSKIVAANLVNVVRSPSLEPSFSVRGPKFILNASLIVRLVPSSRCLIANVELP